MLEVKKFETAAACMGDAVINIFDLDNVFSFCVLSCFIVKVWSSLESNVYMKTRYYTSLLLCLGGNELVFFGGWVFFFFFLVGALWCLL